MNIVKFSLAGLIGAMVMLGISNTVYAEESNTDEIIYINGGVGSEEASEVHAKAHDYNLRLYLSEGKLGHLISDALVSITDKKGDIKLNIDNGGPMLFLQMKKGTYKISAQHNGVTLTKSVTVINHRGENVYLNWKNPAVDAEDEQLKEQ
ncbi:MAG: hypothetical protein V4445_07705 [Pseudomonadota bacterium]